MSKAGLGPARLHWTLRMVNQVGRGLARVGLAPSLAPAAIEELARRETGLEDFGGDAHREGLELLCEELDRHANLTTSGRIAARQALVRGLSNRLLLVDARKRDASLRHEPIVPPLVVIGAPRSGTTFLHRVLCHAPDALPLLTWQLFRPLPPIRGPDRRVELMQRSLEAYRRAAPELDAKHFLSAELPEECMMLLDASFASFTYITQFPAFAYMDWMMARDGIEEYGCWRDYLTIFQRGRPGARLALKAPIHTAFLDAIWHHVPDAKVIYPHRDPVAVVGSFCSTLSSFHSVSVEHIDRARLGRAALRFVEILATRSRAARERNPDKLVVDVYYDELVAKPVETVLHIYEAHGLEVTPALERALAEGVASRPQHMHGRHEYELSDFGLSEAEIHERLD